MLNVAFCNDSAVTCMPFMTDIPGTKLSVTSIPEALRHHVIVLASPKERIQRDGESLRQLGFLGALLVITNTTPSPTMMRDALLSGIDYLVSESDVPTLGAAILIRLTTMNRTNRFGNMTLNPETESVTVDGRPIRLTRLHYHLLCHIVQRHGHAVSRTELVETLRSAGVRIKESSVTVQVSRLNKYLKECGVNGYRVEGVWKGGYQGRITP